MSDEGIDYGARTEGNLLRDELNDEFAGDHIKAKKIDASYRYIRASWTGKAAHFFWYHVVAIPLAKIYMKLYFRHRVENLDVLKKDQRTGLLYVWEPHASSGGCTDPDTGEPTGGCPNDRTSEQCVDADTWQDYAVSGSIAAAG